MFFKMKHKISPYSEIHRSRLSTLSCVESKDLRDGISLFLLLFQYMKQHECNWILITQLLEIFLEHIYAI